MCVCIICGCIVRGITLYLHFGINHLSLLYAADASPYHQNISLASVDTPDDKQASPRMKVIRQSVMEKDKVRVCALLSTGCSSTVCMSLGLQML